VVREPPRIEAEATRSAAVRDVVARHREMDNPYSKDLQVVQSSKRG